MTLAQAKDLATTEAARRAALPPHVKADGTIHPKQLARAHGHDWWLCYGCGSRFQADGRTKKRDRPLFCSICSLRLHGKRVVSVCWICGEPHKHRGTEPRNFCDCCHEAMTERNIHYDPHVAWRECLGWASRRKRKEADADADELEGIACSRKFLSRGPGNRFCPDCDSRRRPTGARVDGMPLHLPGARRNGHAGDQGDDS